MISILAVVINLYCCRDLDATILSTTTAPKAYWCDDADIGNDERQLFPRENNLLMQENTAFTYH